MLDAEELLAVVEGTVGEDDALVVLGEGLGPAGGVVDDAPRELLLALLNSCRASRQSLIMAAW